MKSLLFSLVSLLLFQSSYAQLPCNAQFNWSAAPTAAAPLNVSFSSAGTFTPSGTHHPFYYINYGDGGSSNWLYNGSGNHNYPAPGTYTVGYRMDIMDTLNNLLICTDSTTQVITVAYQPCYSTIATSVNNGVWTLSATTPAGSSGVSYSWNFGDGSPSASGQTVTHTYTNSGVYTVTLSTTGGGMTCTQTANITWFNGLLNCNNVQASFNYVSAAPGVLFYNTSTIPSSFGIIRQASWDFGDGSTSNLQNPYHVYSPGVYTATLVNQWIDSQTQAVLCIDSFSQQITFTPPANEIAGGIGWDSTLNINQSTFKVWLISFDSVTNIISAVDSTTVTAANNSGIVYTFSNHPAGEYRVKAAVVSGAPGAGQLVPTYHHSSVNWATASLVYHSGGSSITSIYMQNGVPGAGPGFIAGNVTQGAGKGTGAGVPGLLVLLRNASGDLQRFTYTDGNGDYSFGNLPAGSYDVYPENMPQVTTPSGTLTLASGNYSVSGIDFEKTSTEIYPKTTGIEDTDLFTRLQITPNPASNMVVAIWPANPGQSATITLADMAGRQIASADGKDGSATFDLSIVPAGLYFITIQTGQRQITEKLFITK